VKELFINVINRIRMIAFGGKLYARDVDTLMERLDWIIETCEEAMQDDEEEKRLQGEGLSDGPRPKG